MNHKSFSTVLQLNGLENDHAAIYLCKQLRQRLEDCALADELCSQFPRESNYINLRFHIWIFALL